MCEAFTTNFAENTGFEDDDLENNEFQNTDFQGFDPYDLENEETDSKHLNNLGNVDEPQ